MTGQWNVTDAGSGDAVKGDFGKSALTDRSVTHELKRRIPITGSLAFGSLVIGHYHRYGGRPRAGRLRR